MKPSEAIEVIAKRLAHKAGVTVELNDGRMLMLLAPAIIQYLDEEHAKSHRGPIIILGDT